MFSNVGGSGCDLCLGLLERDAEIAIVDARETSPALTCWLSVTGTAVM